MYYSDINFYNKIFVNFNNRTRAIVAEYYYFIAFRHTQMLKILSVFFIGNKIFHQINL